MNKLEMAAEALDACGLALSQIPENLRLVQHLNINTSIIKPDNLHSEAKHFRSLLETMKELGD